MKMRFLFTFGLMLLAAGSLTMTQARASEPVPPYPTAGELAALEAMHLPSEWIWNGNIQSGGPPDGKFYGLNVWTGTKLWQGEQITKDEAEALQARLTKACASREFAEALVLVRGRWEDMQDITDRQLVARVNWDSDPSGGPGRHIQTLEVRYRLEGGVCGAIQPMGLIDNPHFKGDMRRWIIY